METKSLEEFPKGLVSSRLNDKALCTSNVCTVESKEFAHGLGKKVDRCIGSLMWNDKCTVGDRLRKLGEELSGGPTRGDIALQRTPFSEVLPASCPGRSEFPRSPSAHLKRLPALLGVLRNRKQATVSCVNRSTSLSIVTLRKQSSRDQRVALEFFIERSTSFIVEAKSLSPSKGRSSMVLWASRGKEEEESHEPWHMTTAVAVDFAAVLAASRDA
ncbi:uncharacterized protein LOC117880036 [Trachemys scripta elegans]|uniref:uncharacterized protein LOC117880036 n=1 Tax=Trachemys scripta elegans TaxID=31138 RepID=UPI00155332FB|nr:uncharacterized protein LOC117880036 [Trachemys scripta elegans]